MPQGVKGSGSAGADDPATLDGLLAAVPLFAGLDAAALADLRQALTPFSLAEAETLFLQNDSADGLYLVVEGEIVVSARTPGDGEIELSRTGPGGELGEICLLDGGSRSAEAVAAADTTGYRLDLARFAALRAGERPAALEVLERLRAEVAARTRATIERIAASLDTMATERPAPALPTPAPANDAADCAELLRTFPGFDALTRDGWREFERLASKMQVTRGMRLELPGKPVGGLHVVARGALRAGLPVAEGVEQLLVHGPGSLAGAAGLIDGADWPLALDAREDAVVFTLDASDLAALKATGSPLADRLFDMLGHQLTRDLRRITRARSRQQSQLAERQGNA